MNLHQRIESLERHAAQSRRDDPRDGAVTVVMMYLTIGGLMPHDPADTIAARYGAVLKQMGLDPEPDDEARIEHIRMWYLRGVASVGWRLDSP
jgi:hypothetical protein